MNIKRNLRFSIAGVLMAMVITALVGRLSLDHMRTVQLNQELALHDSVELQRSIVAQKQLEVEALKNQLTRETNIQLIDRYVLPASSNHDDEVVRIAITPSAIPPRQELARIRNAGLRLMREQAVLVERENKLRSKVEARVPKR